jgi:alanyl-tRNA synthetase
MDWSILLNMCGGLGLFLFGMKLMSEAIEKSAGAKLRSILEFFTKNKFSGLIVGIIFTAIIQSSSACTVMVVSFVNAGLIVKDAAVSSEGNGGGSPTFAQGGGKTAKELDNIEKHIKKVISNHE